MTDETQCDDEMTEAEEVVSGFDAFLDKFSTQNLESRVRFISLGLVGLLLITLVLAVLGLGLDFEVSERVVATPQGSGRYAFVLDDKFERFLTARPDIFRENGEAVLYDEFHVEKNGAAVTVSIALAEAGETDTPAWPAKIVFQRKKILSLLLESSREGSDGGVPEI